MRRSGAVVGRHSVPLQDRELHESAPQALLAVRYEHRSRGSGPTHTPAVQAAGGKQSTAVSGSQGLCSPTQVTVNGSRPPCAAGPIRSWRPDSLLLQVECAFDLGHSLVQSLADLAHDFGTQTAALGATPDEFEQAPDTLHHVPEILGIVFPRLVLE